MAAYLKNPESVSLGDSKPVSRVKQSVVKVSLKEKDEKVLDELSKRQGSVIIFMKTKYKTDRLMKYLKGYGVEVESIHGGRNQSQRSRSIQQFKKGNARVLVATDIVARGLDAPHVEHVINYDLPMQEEDYVHRVGRTARNGAEGEAVSFVMPNEVRAWNRLAKKYEIVDCEIEMPSKGSKKSASTSNGGGRSQKNKRSGSSDRNRRGGSSDRNKRSRSSGRDKNREFSSRRSKSTKPPQEKTTPSMKDIFGDDIPEDGKPRKVPAGPKKASKGSGTSKKAKDKGKPNPFRRPKKKASKKKASSKRGSRPGGKKTSKKTGGSGPNKKKKHNKRRK